MRRLKWLVLGLVTLAATACGEYVTKTDFAVYRADVKASGDAVNAWIAAAHTNIMWLRQIVIAKHCGPGSSCDPPAAPPPPPDGGWGGS